MRECEAVAAATPTAGGCRTGQSGFMTTKAIKKHEKQQQQQQPQRRQQQKLNSFKRRERSQITKARYTHTQTHTRAHSYSYVKQAEKERERRSQDGERGRHKAQESIDNFIRFACLPVVAEGLWVRANQVRGAITGKVVSMWRRCLPVSMRVCACVYFEHSR